MENINSYAIAHMNKTAAAILRLYNATGGCSRDADTVLEDILDDMEREVSGVGPEIIKIYLESKDKPNFCRAFEALTGTTWDSYLAESFRVMNQCAPDVKSEIGEWLDVEEEELYVPDKHFTTYHTKQTCSACGVRTTFVGQKPYINEQHCPVCGTQMNPRWVFHHEPTIPDATNIIGYKHENGLKSAGDITPKDMNSNL